MLFLHVLICLLLGAYRSWNAFCRVSMSVSAGVVGPLQGHVLSRPHLEKHFCTMIPKRSEL